MTLVVMGVSGAGKTTIAVLLADRLGWRRAEGDDFHSPENIRKMHAAIPLTDADREPWLRSIAGWIGERERARESSVVTCSALRRRYRDILRDGHPSVQFVHLLAPPGVIADRMRSRSGHFMPPELAASQAATLEPLEPDEPGIVIEALGSPEGVAAEIVDRLGLAR